jgi:hypothetical protein
MSSFVKRRDPGTQTFVEFGCWIHREPNSQNIGDHELHELVVVGILVCEGRGEIFGT